MTAENNHELLESRYQRQEALLRDKGWDQSKLDKAKVALVGSDSLVNYSALALTAFGFGNIELYAQGKVDEQIKVNHARGSDPDYTKGFLFFDSNLCETKAKSLENLISKINPKINFRGINIGMQRFENCRIIGKPDIIIEATNDPCSKINLIDYAIANEIPIISMSSGLHKGGVGIIKSKDDAKRNLIENLLFYELKDENQDIAVSQVISGLGIEETRKIINPLKNEQVIDDLIIYNRLSRKRFDHSKDNKINLGYDLSSYSACIIGAGALGNFVGLGMALSGIGNLVIVDYDITEITNLNRQILLYDAVGKEKSKSLVEKLRQINPNVNYTALVEKITPDSYNLFQDNHFDIIIDTVDNNQTRALLNYFSLKYKIPFISGGTSYNSGQVNIYVPGKTGCLNCQADIDKLALRNYRRRSCIYAAQPSVITSNQITAGLIVGELPYILNPGKYGDFARGELKFVSNEEYRLSLLPPAVEKCDCHKNKSALKRWNKKMKGVYE